MDKKATTDKYIWLIFFQNGAQGSYALWVVHKYEANNQNRNTLLYLCISCNNVIGGQDQSSPDQVNCNWI